jgi:hypothetical protein
MKHRWMVGLPCLVCQVGHSWVDVEAVFTHVCLESCTWPVPIFTIDQRKDQQVCIKFCANLGKHATETLTLIQQASGDESLRVVCSCFNGMLGWRPVTHHLTMTNTQGDPQAAQLLKLLQEFKSSSVRNDVGPVTTLLRRWELVMAHANGIWRNNWACTVSQSNLCPGSWQLTRSSSAHFRPHPAVSGEKQNGCHPPPTVLPWFGTLWLLPISKNEIEAEKTPVW